MIEENRVIDQNKVKCQNTLASPTITRDQVIGQNRIKGQNMLASNTITLDQGHRSKTWSKVKAGSRVKTCYHVTWDELY